MPRYSETLDRLIAEFERLPGIGAKTAERLAFHVLRSGAEEAMGLARAIRDVKAKIRPCAECFNIAEGGGPCAVCADAGRDRGLVCVVEQPKDLLALERTARYRGLYHVLLGRLAPLEGAGPERLTVDALVERVRRGGVREVILATNPDLEGDGTALYVAERLKGLPVAVTRIAKGIPSGSSIEYANDAILSDALEGRRPVPPE
jgi:recombination protein RecR